MSSCNFSFCFSRHFSYLLICLGVVNISTLSFITTAAPVEVMAWAEVDSRYVLKRFLRNPHCSGWKNSKRSSGLAHLLSGILLTGGRRGCGALGVIRFGSSNFGYSGVAGTRHCDDLFYRVVVRGSRFKGTQFTSAGLSYTGDDPAYTLPERLLDPVGVGNGVDRDYGLDHGHPAHVGVVVAHAGEDDR